MSQFKCKECGKEFEARKGFHCHLKAHSLTIGDYYVKNYKKKDLFTGDLLQFKNYDSYFSFDFNSFENYLSWLRISPKKVSKEYVLEQSRQRFKDKKIKISPPNLYYDLSLMANIATCRSLWGSYENFTKEAGLKNIFNKSLPKGFWDRNTDDVCVFVDTREKKPFKFPCSRIQKLDFGDYTVGGELYSKTFVDRKAQDDFRQTFGSGIERFRREMDRCVQFGCYMFVVVESSIEKLEEDNRVSKFKSNLGFVWHNVRQLMLDYPENLQFVFAHNRAGTKKITPLILLYGKELWNIDVQYHIDKIIHGEKQRKTLISA